MSIRVFTPIYLMMLAIRDYIDFSLTLEAILSKVASGITHLPSPILWSKWSSTRTSATSGTWIAWGTGSKLTATRTHTIT